MKRTCIPNHVSRQKKSQGVIAAKGSTRHVDRLYKAVQNYIESGGGKLVVVGGIGIQEWPGEGTYSFRVAIRCSGRKPEFADSVSYGSGTFDAFR